MGLEMGLGFRCQRKMPEAQRWRVRNEWDESRAEFMCTGGKEKDREGRGGVEGGDNCSGPAQRVSSPPGPSKAFPNVSFSEKI